MTQATRRVGPIEVTAFLDADFGEAPIVEAFPDVDPAALLAAKATYPGVYTDDDRWRLRVRAWVVRHPGGLLVMDTGLGGAIAPASSWTPEPGAFLERLEAAGVARHHVDTVVLSHIHDDHIGGLLLDDGTPAFPNARHVLQSADLAWQRDLARESEEDRAILAHVEPLVHAGMMDLPDGDTTLTPHLQLHHLPGHTPGHQVLRITADGGRLVIAADTWNHPSQFAHPDWPSGPDAHHAQAAAARRTLLAELLSNPGAVIAPTHLAEPFGEVRFGRDGLAVWHPVG